ncbi:MAG: M28 family peptidase [Myxococcota bacterium]|jgi:Zn-dependent M28 family amino/carboxypeptidase|nr:M28 family peptidase [Myxococcota bacterium]
MIRTDQPHVATTTEPPLWRTTPLGLAALLMLTTAALACRPGASPAAPNRGEPRSQATLSTPELQSIIEMLGSDLFEGRAPGTRGGDLSAAYVRSLLKLMGLSPGHGEDYFQKVPLRGIKTSNLILSARGARCEHGKDIMGMHVGQNGPFEVKAEAVFVGFGIQAPQWSWDDFKDVNLRGKFLVARVNDPGSFDATIFEGKSLTYYGRWTYHIEEAARRGAVGILLIHTDASAGYGWQVVQNSWGGESLLLEEDASSLLEYRGWIREAAFARMLEGTPHGLSALYEASQSRQFRPIDLGFSIIIGGHSESRQFEGTNVVAKIPGQTDEQIVLSAHIDHLGTSDRKDNDNIYNGAIDNGSAVAALLLSARALASSPKALRSTVTVLACDAEESGLLGADYFVRHAERDRIIANINFESTPVWGKATTLMGVGARFSTLQDTLERVAKKLGLGVSEFSMVDQGFYYRSDQFPFARRGIPALWLSAGEDDDSGQRKYPAFWKGAYHTVDDEYDPSWPLQGLAQTVTAAVAFVYELDNEPTRPTWKPGLPFPMLEERNLR